MAAQNATAERHCFSSGGTCLHQGAQQSRRDEVRVLTLPYTTAVLEKLELQN